MAKFRSMRVRVMQKRAYGGGCALGLWRRAHHHAWLGCRSRHSLLWSAALDGRAVDSVRSPMANDCPEPTGAVRARAE